MTHPYGRIVDVVAPAASEVAETALTVAGLRTAVTVDVDTTHAISPVSAAAVRIPRNVLEEREAQLCLFAPSALVVVTDTPRQVRTSVKITTVKHDKMSDTRLSATRYKKMLIDVTENSLSRKFYNKQ
jgi:hypothetical protein